MTTLLAAGDLPHQFETGTIRLLAEAFRLLHAMSEARLPAARLDGGLLLKPATTGHCDVIGPTDSQRGQAMRPKQANQADASDAARLSQGTSAAAANPAHANKNAAANEPAGPQRRPSPAAERALAEAAARRAARDPDPAKPPSEVGGRRGLDPTRYGDWEVNGLASDF